MRLLRFYVDDFIIKEFLFVYWLALVVAEVKGLENVRLVEFGVIQLRFVRLVILLTFDHFLYLNYTFALLERLGPFAVWLASRRYHE